MGGKNFKVKAMQKLPEKHSTSVLKWGSMKMEHTRKRGQVKPVVLSAKEDKGSSVPVRVWPRKAMVWKDRMKAIPA